MFTLPEKITVGTKDKVPFSTESFPLSFLTPYGEDKAYEKRLRTLKDWQGDGKVVHWIYDDEGLHKIDANGKWDHTVTYNTNDPQTLDNVPIMGFMVEKSVTRWTTSNKWIQIRDPRGFSIQISTENFVKCILDGTLSNGNFVGTYVWLRKDSQNWLASIDSEEYKEATKERGGDLIPGDEIVDSYRNNLIYIGRFWVVKWTYIEGPLKWSYWNYTHNESREIKFVWNKPEQMEVFQSNNRYNFYKNLPKYYKTGNTGPYSIELGKLDSFGKCGNSSLQVLFSDEKSAKEYVTNDVEAVRAYFGNEIPKDEWRLSHYTRMMGAIKNEEKRDSGSISNGVVSGSESGNNQGGNLLV